LDLALAGMVSASGRIDLALAGMVSASGKLVPAIAKMDPAVVEMNLPEGICHII